ncbi:MAG: DUF262 domain-containing protein [Anaerolineales bacterium]|nr:DUF262 domain-containing protein [Anaerolineales bacterium]
MAKAEASVEELVSMIERGELRLPEMQRQYVWRSTRVRDLLDSLYRGYPSGAILIWETDEDIPQQDFAVVQSKNPYQATRLLLDGQQRLTSLLSVIRGEPVTVRGRKKPIEILFNLEHPDDLSLVTEVFEDSDENGQDDAVDSSEDELMQRFEKMTFLVSTNKLKSTPHWVKVSDVFKTEEDAPFLAKAGIEKINDPLYTKYSQRLARLRGIRKYVYRMDVLERQLSYEEVTEIFIRINSLGAKLRSSDLALAQITAKWRDSLKIFQDFQAECGKQNFYLDLGIHLRNMIVFATGQSRFNSVGRLSVKSLQDSWETACKGMNFAINFLKSNVGIDYPVLLSSPFLIVALAYIADKNKYMFSSTEAQKLRYWVLIANAKGRYSRGSSETLLDQDIATVRDGGDADALIERLRNQVGLLDISPEELAGRNQLSALFKTMFLAFRDADARDWSSSLAIALDHSGVQHRLQFHHIFPKGVLKGFVSSREADDISNLAFIGGKTNRAISDKPPLAYFQPILEKSGGKLFEAQCIPTDPALLEISNYSRFLEERRKLIASRLNTFVQEGSRK